MKTALFSPELAPKVFGNITLDLMKGFTSVQVEKKVVKKVKSKNPLLYNLHMKDLVPIPKGF